MPLSSSNPSERVVIAGGGPAGIFAAITCIEASPGTEVLVLEKTAQFLSKVRVSGGGRCNVTNSCRDPRELIHNYPRGGRALLGPFMEFGTSEAAEWFEQRGVELKTEADGRVFPSTNTSQTIIDCLMGAANRAGVRMLPNCGVDGVERTANGFVVRTTGGQKFECGRLMLATGGCRGGAGGHPAVALGHSMGPSVPSLFSFEIRLPWLNGLAGIALPGVEVSIPDLSLHGEGAMVITHSGLSGPAILRLSAWGARELSGLGYSFEIRINWLSGWDTGRIEAGLDSRRKDQPARRVINSPLPPIPTRLWERLVELSGIPAETRLAELSRSARHRLIQQLTRTTLAVSGKSLNREEFVTCGGVQLREVNFKTMQSRICPGLFFGGELLDIDGLTGGYNFQAAWTTGWLAGRAMAS